MISFALIFSKSISAGCCRLEISSGLWIQYTWSIHGYIFISKLEFFLLEFECRSTILRANLEAKEAKQSLQGLTKYWDVSRTMWSEQIELFGGRISIKEYISTQKDFKLSCAQWTCLRYNIFVREKSLKNQGNRLFFYYLFYYLITAFGTLNVHCWQSRY